MNNRPPLSSPQATQEDSGRYGALLQVVEAIATHSDLPSLIQDLARRLPMLVPVNFVGLSLYDAQRDIMRLHVLQANVPADIIGGQEAPPATHRPAWCGTPSVHY